MSTFMEKKQNVERKWYVIDAAGKPLGRVAAQAAVLLRGKHKPTFTPHVDCGDHVIIINCADAVLTGKKLNQKYYYRHTGYIGHLKATRYDTLMTANPTKAMELAVKGMVPSNTIGRAAMTRLKLYAGAQHKHEAQKPEEWTK
ncbi:MAG: 50S ribosomal protein L13 [Acutalibacteraceae bacterium]